MIYIDKNKKKMYYVGEQLYCETCKKEINMIVRIVLNYQPKKWQKIKNTMKKYCVRCCTKDKSFGVLKQQIDCIITKSRPKGTMIFRPSIPSFKSLDNSQTVFNSAFTESVETIDRTVHSRRLSWQGAKVGKITHEKKDKEREREVIEFYDDYIDN